MTLTSPSKAYQVALAQSIQHHQSSKTYSGSLMRPHAPAIKMVIDKLGCQSVLDYGAGKGSQYEWVMPESGQTVEQYWGVPVTKYDPAWPPYATEPVGKYDLVICTHTLGAIPTEDLGWVVDRLYALAGKALYIAERIGHVRKKVHEAHATSEMRSSIDWLNIIYPHRVEGIETVLAVKYHHEAGVVSGAFAF